MQIKKHQKSQKHRSNLKLGQKVHKRIVPGPVINSRHIPWFSPQVLTANRKTKKVNFVAPAVRTLA